MIKSYALRIFAFPYPWRPDDVLDVMKKMPDKEYDSMADIFKAVGPVGQVRRGRPF
jgi:hypothetical protein